MQNETNGRAERRRFSPAISKILFTYQSRIGSSPLRKLGRDYSILRQLNLNANDRLFDLTLKFI